MQTVTGGFNRATQYNADIREGFYLTRGELLLQGLPPGFCALSGKYPLTPPTAKLMTK